LRKHWKMGLLAIVSSGFASSAFAQNTTFTFHGTCSDCSGTATATLVLANYTLGQPITGSNFVSFTYNGTNLGGPFTIAPGPQSSFFPYATDFGVSGSINMIPGANNFTAAQNLPHIIFSSQSNGDWYAGADDYGTAGTWTAAPPATPAPPTSVLVGVGLLTFAAFGLWRRHRRTGRDEDLAG
jgi:hypothetical protein